MRKTVKFLIVILILLSSTVVVTATSLSDGSEIRRTPDHLNSVLATVNGEPISMGDVLQLTRAKEYQAASAYTGTILAQAVYKLRLAAVDELIDQKLILSDYESRPFEIAMRDIEAAVDDAGIRMGCRSRSDLIRRLRENGTTLEKFRDDIRRQMIVQLMLHREYSAAVFVTPGDMHRYYREHEAEFSYPESIELAMLQLMPEGGKEAEQCIEEIAATLASTPESFADMVSRYSIGPGRSDGGKLGKIECKRLRPEFADALGEKPVVGSVSGPLRTADGVFWLKVLEYHPAKVISFGEAGGDIRKHLEREAKRECRERYIARLRKAAIVRYFIPAVVPDSSSVRHETGRDVVK